MLHFLEKRDLSDRCARNTFILLLQSDLLQSDGLVSELITRLVHHAVCPFSDLLHFLVLNHTQKCKSVQKKKIRRVKEY